MLKYEKTHYDVRIVSPGYPVGESILYATKTVKIMAMVIRDVFPDGDINLFCSGSSGAILSGIIASNTEILTIYHIKKVGENSHSSNNCRLLDRYIYNEFGTELIRSVPPKAQINIIVDDFITSGTTVARVYDNFKKYNEDYTMHGLIVAGSICKENDLFSHMEINTLISTY